MPVTFAAPSAKAAGWARTIAYLAQPAQLRPRYHSQAVELAVLGESRNAVWAIPFTYTDQPLWCLLVRISRWPGNMFNCSPQGPRSRASATGRGPDQTGLFDCRVSLNHAVQIGAQIRSKHESRSVSLRTDRQGQAFLNQIFNPCNITSGCIFPINFSRVGDVITATHQRCSCSLLFYRGGRQLSHNLEIWGQPHGAKAARRRLIATRRRRR